MIVNNYIDYNILFNKKKKRNFKIRIKNKQMKTFLHFVESWFYCERFTCAHYSKKNKKKGSL